MAKKGPRSTREMNSSETSQERGTNRGNGDRETRNSSTGGRQSRQTGGEMEDSHDLSRFEMESSSRGSNRQTAERGNERSRGRRGSGRFPMDNLTYDIVTVLHEKSKGLEAFNRYLQDARGDEVEDLLEDIRDQDERAIDQLQDHLFRLLNESGRGKRAA